MVAAFDPDRVEDEWVKSRLGAGRDCGYLAPVPETTKTRVIIGMSGGVDSSAAAALLLEQGYDVVGITLKLWPQDCVSRAEDKCCGPQAVTDARSVCYKLGIPYYLIDEADAFPKAGHPLFCRGIQGRPHAEPLRDVQ